MCACCRSAARTFVTLFRTTMFRMWCNSTQHSLISVCRIPNWRLHRLRTLVVVCRNLTFEPNWSSGGKLQKLDLRCYRLCIDTEWVPETNLSLDFRFGPIKASEVDCNTAIQLLNTWKGLDIAYQPVLWQGEDCRKVRARREGQKWESALFLLERNMRNVTAAEFVAKRQRGLGLCV